MAITYDSTSTYDAGNVSSYSFNHTVSGTGTFLVVGIGVRQGGSSPVSSVTYNGVSLTQAKFIQSTTPGNSCSAEIWYLASPTSGTNSVEVTLGSSYRSVAIVNSFAGVSGLGSTASKERGTSGSGTIADMNIITTSSGEMVVDFTNCLKNTTQSITPGSSQTESSEASWSVGFNGGTSSTSYATVASASTFTTQETLLSSDTWAHVALSMTAGPSTTTSTTSSSSSTSSTSTSSTSSSTSSTSSSTSSTSHSTSTSSTSSSSSSSTSHSTSSSSTSSTSSSSTSTSTTHTGTTTTSSSSTSSSSTSSTSSSTSSSSTSSTSSSTSTVYPYKRLPHIDQRVEDIRINFRM